MPSCSEFNKCTIAYVIFELVLSFNQRGFLGVLQNIFSSIFSAYSHTFYGLYLSI